MTSFEKIERMPFFLKAIIGGGPILLIIIYLLFLGNTRTKNREQFYKQGFSAVVLRSDTSSTGRAIEFHLSNGLDLYFGFSTNTVKVGDSIKKNINTYNYDVYRKNADGNYTFWTTFNFLKTL